MRTSLGSADLPAADRLQGTAELADDVLLPVHRRDLQPRTAGAMRPRAVADEALTAVPEERIPRPIGGTREAAPHLRVDPQGLPLDAEGSPRPQRLDGAPAGRGPVTAESDAPAGGGVRPRDVALRSIEFALRPAPHQQCEPQRGGGKAAGGHAREAITAPRWVRNARTGAAGTPPTPRGRSPAGRRGNPSAVRRAHHTMGPGRPSARRRPGGHRRRQRDRRGRPRRRSGRRRDRRGTGGHRERRDGGRADRLRRSHWAGYRLHFARGLRAVHPGRLQLDLVLRAQWCLRQHLEPDLQLTASPSAGPSRLTAAATPAPAASRPARAAPRRAAVAAPLRGRAGAQGRRLGLARPWPLDCPHGAAGSRRASARGGRPQRGGAPRACAA